MIQKGFHDKHYDSIQALRGVTALLVVLEHVRFLNCGAFGVDIFFCISGFMIMFATHKSTDKFLIKRLIRIVPLYYLMTFGTFLLLLLFPAMFQQTVAEPEYLIKSLLFIPFDIGGGIIQPLVRIGWTINCEMLFYVLFMIAFRINHKYRANICAALLILLVGFGQMYGESSVILKFYGDPVMLEFILGMFAYYVAWAIHTFYDKGVLKPIVSKMALVVVAVLLMGLIITKPSVNILGARRFLVWGIPAMVIVLCVFVAGLRLQMPQCLVKLGNISFSLYLIHYYPVMFLDRMGFDFSQCTPRAIVGVGVCLALCICAAYVVWYVVEKKLCGFLLGKLKKV